MKPQPPADLWAKLSQAVEEVNFSSRVPGDAFTRDEFAKNQGLTDAVAAKTLGRLLRAKKIKFITRIGARVYYKLVE